METEQGTEKPQDALLTKIRALLAKAERTENAHEAEVFTAKAVELMAKYAIDEAAVRAVSGEKVTIINRKIEVFGPYVTQKMSLFNVIAVRSRCQLINLGRYASDFQLTAKTSKVVHIFGCETDVDFVEMLFSSLLIQQAIEINHATIPPYENTKTFRTSFMQGYSSVIASRLNAINKEADKEASTSSALVLVNDKKAAAAAMMGEYPNMRTVVRRSSIGSRSGHTQGNAAANRANIGSSQIGQRKQIK